MIERCPQLVVARRGDVPDSSLTPRRARPCRRVGCNHDGNALGGGGERLPNAERALFSLLSSGERHIEDMQRNLSAKIESAISPSSLMRALAERSGGCGQARRGHRRMRRFARRLRLRAWDVGG